MFCSGIHYHSWIIICMQHCVWQHGAEHVLSKHRNVLDRNSQLGAHPHSIKRYKNTKSMTCLPRRSEDSIGDVDKQQK